MSRVKIRVSLLIILCIALATGVSLAATLIWQSDVSLDHVAWRRLLLLIGIFSGWALAFDLLFLLPLASFRSPHATEPDAFSWLFVSLISAASFAVVAGFLTFQFDPTYFAMAAAVKMGAYPVIAYRYPVSESE